MDIADLRGLFLFDGVSDEQLGELLAAGEAVSFEEGQVLFREGDSADDWWVLIDGRVDLARRAGREEAVVMMTMERPGVWAGGFRAWNDESSYLATAQGASAGTMFRVPSEALGRLTRAWFPFSVHLIEGFFQTVRTMDSLSRQREALIALGQLAAGLAHEINNPAAAASRAVSALSDATETLRTALRQLGERSLSPEQFVAVDDLRREIESLPSDLDPLAMADREESLIGWLEDRDVVNAWRIGPALAAAGVDIDWCERAAAVLDATTLEPGLEWVAGTLTTGALVGEVKEATGRISTLVDAVKSYSQLDRASQQVIDVTEGIESTLVMLRHKLRDGIAIERDYGVDVPSIEANPGELNQVWTNLIDNAVDAMDGNGTLRISTSVDGDDLVVEIGDTGPGMPPDVQARAFEAFFTTKEVGKGSGLGLDISRRIISGHHGQIAIESSANGTVMRVRLPRNV
ncbi:MAG: ATP-binding protein [Acidimicrobiia bacterium]